MWGVSAANPVWGIFRRVVRAGPALSHSRRSLHGLVLVATRSRSKVADIDVVILLQFLQTRQDLLLDQVLALGRGGDRLSGLLDLDQSLVLRQAAQGVDQNGIGLGDVETNVGDFICHQAVQNGNNGAFDNVERNNGGEGLVSLECFDRKGKTSIRTETAKHVVIR